MGCWYRPVLPARVLSRRRASVGVGPAGFVVDVVGWQIELACRAAPLADEVVGGAGQGGMPPKLDDSFRTSRSKLVPVILPAVTATTLQREGLEYHALDELALHLQDGIAGRAHPEPLAIALLARWVVLNHPTSRSI